MKRVELRLRSVSNLSVSSLTLLLGAGLAVSFIACSSSEQKLDAEAIDNKGAQAPQEQSLDVEAKTEEKLPPPPEGLEKQETKKIDLGDRYKALGAALKSGSDAQVFEQASFLLAHQPDDPVTLNALAMIYLRKKKPGAARILLARALEKNPNNSGINNNLGVAFMMEGDEDAAKAAFKKAVQGDERSAVASANLGAFYIRGGDYAKALPLLERAHRYISDDLSVANNYAIALRGSGNHQEAARIYERLVQTYTKDVAIHLNYAILLVEHLKRPKDALPLVYRVKFLETEKRDVINRADALEAKAKSATE